MRRWWAIAVDVRTGSPVPFVSDVAPLVGSVVVRLGMRALPRAAAALMVAGAPTPFAVPAPGAVRRRVGVRLSRHRDAGGQQERSSTNHRPARLHRTLQLLVV